MNYQPSRTGNRGNTQTKVACSLCGTQKSIRAFIFGREEIRVRWSNGDEAITSSSPILCKDGRACNARMAEIGLSVVKA